jgi:cyclopropane fatty-acyl-phospholipid synthase-like methyltransferase
MNRDLIRKSYNQAAAAYARDRLSWRSNKHLQQLMNLLPKGAELLDLGCGDGIPVAELLIKKGFLVTGIDISEVQIQRAKKNCPRASFICQDMATLENGEFNVDALIALYSVFHLPRKSHLSFLKKINSFLEIGGLALVSMGDSDFEGFHDFYGTKMWSSHYGLEKNRSLFKVAGFEIIFEDLDKRARERHQIILAKKIS